MAFDGITVSALVAEIDDNLKGGRINKIAQPENDELLITGKGANGQKRLLLSASASLPLIYFTDKNRISPLTAPNFCMLLRKHIGSARILDVKQPGMERVVEFELEHLNELGDVCHKVLIMELMGKHSNIIFCDEKGMILDSIKHVSSHMSSVREVLPGREYFIPNTRDKENPLTVSEEEFTQHICKKPVNMRQPAPIFIIPFSALWNRFGTESSPQILSTAERSLWNTVSFLINSLAVNTAAKSLTVSLLCWRPIMLPKVC